MIIALNSLVSLKSSESIGLNSCVLFSKIIIKAENMLGSKLSRSLASVR